MKCLQELTNNLSKNEQLEQCDPKRDLNGYKLQVFELYKKEICLKHGWEYISPSYRDPDEQETADLDVETRGISKEVDMETTIPEKTNIDDEIYNKEDVEIND